MGYSEELLDAIPATSGRPRSVEPLPGGLTNENVKVTTPDGSVVVRCWNSDASLLGIDRDGEHANSVAAAEAGVGAPVVDYRPDLGVLVVGFIGGTTWDNASFGETGAPARAGRAMRQLHEGPRFVSDFDMFARQARYLELVRRHGYWLPSGYDDHEAALRRVQGALGRTATVPCNNDLLAANFIDDGDKVWLIDYEYSGNNDPAFELGNTATECDLAPEQVEEMVTAYAGGPSPGLLARVRLQSAVSAYGWSLWGSIQAATSPLDFDFRAWCLERYEKAAAAFTSSDLDALVDEVAGR